MSQLLVKQAVGGEACKALVPGYDIAAKTGTASIPSLGGNYLPGTTIASTAAYGPVDNDPSHEYIVLVKVDKPADQWGFRGGRAGGSRYLPAPLPVVQDSAGSTPGAAYRWRVQGRQSADHRAVDAAAIRNALLHLPETR